MFVPHHMSSKTRNWLTLKRNLYAWIVSLETEDDWHIQHQRAKSTHMFDIFSHLFSHQHCRSFSPKIDAWCLDAQCIPSQIWCNHYHYRSSIQSFSIATFPSYQDLFLYSRGCFLGNLCTSSKAYAADIYWHASDLKGVSFKSLSSFIDMIYIWAIKMSDSMLVSPYKGNIHKHWITHHKVLNEVGCLENGCGLIVILPIKLRWMFIGLVFWVFFVLIGNMDIAL